MAKPHWLAALAVALMSVAAGSTDDLQRRALHTELTQVKHRILFESNRAGNWDIWIVNADGSGLRNLTNTPTIDEIHAHASPDGSRVVFIGDRVSRRGRRKRVRRATYLMNIDGTGRTKIADGVQNPCFNHDGSAVALVKSSRVNPTTEYHTGDLFIYDVKTRQMRNVRRGFFKGVFALTWSPDDRWFLFAQEGMKRFGYQLLLTDAAGRHVYPVKNYGCRPDFSPDGTRIAWNTSDQHIAVGRIDLAGLKPGQREPVVLTDLRHVARVSKGKVYYVDWSPDGQYLAYARGHAAKVGHSFKGTGKWRIWVTRGTELSPDRLPIAVPVTSPPSGRDDKEPDWVPFNPKPATSRPAKDPRTPVERALDGLGDHIREEMGKPR